MAPVILIMTSVVDPRCGIRTLSRAKTALRVTENACKTGVLTSSLALLRFAHPINPASRGRSRQTPSTPASCPNHVPEGIPATRSRHEEVDLLGVKGHPDGLLKEPITDLPDRYPKLFLRLAQCAGSGRALIQSGTLKLTYDLHRIRPSSIPGEPQSPYACDVSIVDIRGKDYVAHFERWWFAERMAENRPFSPFVREWWNPPDHAETRCHVPSARRFRELPNMYLPIYHPEND
jgi:hypothetical protein